MITDLRPNVMYELGLAHAFRKPVLILMKGSQEDVDREAPFDVKTHTILSYSQIDGLQERYRSMLDETRTKLIAAPYLSFQPAKLERGA